MIVDLDFLFELPQWKIPDTIWANVQLEPFDVADLKKNFSKEVAKKAEVKKEVKAKEISVNHFLGHHQLFFSLLAAGGGQETVNRRKNAPRSAPKAKKRAKISTEGENTRQN